MKKSLFLALFLSFFHYASSQKEDYVWRYSYNGGIDFKTGTPDTFSVTKITSLDYSNTSICNGASGDLLFYTNGIAIFNKNDDTLLNGDNLNPSNFSSTYWSGIPFSSADIIIQRPNHSEQYYLFHQTIDDDLTANYYSNILYWSVIDMTLDGGNGGVTNIKNHHLWDNDTLLAGNLAAVRHANGRDWWLISKKLLYPHFYKWLITPYNIIGPYIQSNQPARGSFSDQGSGQACFSIQGDKYAVMYNSKYLYLYDFDRCSGNLTYLASKFLNDNSNLSSWGMGCAFSFSGRYLYVSTNYFIYQFDLTSGDILASQTIVALYDDFLCPVAARFNMMKLAPDGKIYVSTDNGCAVGTNFIHVIEYPDSAGLSCNVKQHSLKVAANNATSFPNIPNYRLGALSGTECDSLTGIDELSKQDLEIKVYPNPTKGTITIQFGDIEDIQYSISIMDLTGRIVINTDGKTTEGFNYRELDMSKLEKGIYFISLRTNDSNDLIKIVLQ